MFQVLIIIQVFFLIQPTEGRHRSGSVVYGDHNGTNHSSIILQLSLPYSFVKNATCDSLLEAIGFKDCPKNYSDPCYIVYNHDYHFDEYYHHDHYFNDDYPYYDDHYFDNFYWMEDDYSKLFGDHYFGYDNSISHDPGHRGRKMKFEAERYGNNHNENKYIVVELYLNSNILKNKTFAKVFQAFYSYNCTANITNKFAYYADYHPTEDHINNAEQDQGGSQMVFGGQVTNGIGTMEEDEETGAMGFNQFDYSEQDPYGEASSGQNGMGAEMEYDEGTGLNTMGLDHTSEDRYGENLGEEWRDGM